MPQTGVSRVTVALDPADVDLLDRLAALEGSNRSAVLRSLLGEVRPMLVQTVGAFEAAVAARKQLDEAAASATVSELEQIRDEVEAMHLRALGAVAKLEGLAASDPRRSNHGGHTPTPTPEDEDS
ncbi:ribbon-helix-helix protein, CopG family [Curtobacterium sp. PhB115]|uniref:ribbon-helix-helix protein, CopG family n=1 Tax=Curtobacterium sp. PhB115 TaxID=2485173 RepID=UPI000FBD6AED|nr:ribbon-helix-helix protein, CopG family [Curtobacterium sp. PhB115]ROP78974.1 ribbon-helix-helix CopG family protein [Curtobacterium sp. PhB115]